MNDRDSDEVANPHRTQVDEQDQLTTGRPTPDAADEGRRPRRDKHDQPWGEVAEEVREAVEEADGPLD
jgi:hypothetical protein